MARRLVNMRLDEGLLARVDAVAGPRRRTVWVERALEQALSRTPREGADSATPTRAPVEKDPDAYIGSTPVFSTPDVVPAPSRLACPVPGCGFTASSPRAVCARHGRTVR